MDPGIRYPLVVDPNPRGSLVLARNALSAVVNAFNEFHDGRVGAAIDALKKAQAAIGEVTSLATIDAEERLVWAEASQFLYRCQLTLVAFMEGPYDDFIELDFDDISTEELFEGAK